MTDLNSKTNTSSPADVVPAAPLSPSAYELRRPVYIGPVNWVGLGMLYQREVQRFLKIAIQTLAAPVITSILFLMVFSVAIGKRASFAGDIDCVTFLVPGVVMMNVLQNAFANTSSSLVVSKVQGNIVDLLMPPLWSGELLFGLAAAGMMRGRASCPPRQAQTTVHLTTKAA